MTRILVSLDERDKCWLERRSRENGVSMAEVVRKALRKLQQAEEQSLEQLLEDTRGVWQGEDGLKYQQEIRDEWK